MEIHIFKNDLPQKFLEDIQSIAVDTETMGLRPYRDRLCLAQFSKGDGNCFLVQFETFDEAHNIKSILTNQTILKIFHYARFDMMILYKYLGVITQNIYCSKIASKLARTYSSKHGLADICKELIGVEISKEQTCTDWGNLDLTQKQIEYAAKDVLYLHELKSKLDCMLVREKRKDLAESCFRFLETRVLLDLMVGEDYDIFSHDSNH
ncbi:MAG: ribonuclease D [Holosporales bacterium]|nr:ribonuclease D [Holosporales bacterium]